ncbi:P-loop containing nucleoside triphosphate hydrolase protein [Trametes gibbosa]|nr:P-loop containing nucleoside triphosphate hydrolase protein [Trametes gibbosa]
MLSPNQQRAPTDAERVEVPFANTAYGKSAKDLHEFMRSVRAKGVQTELNLPRIAVIGNQSSGKSSLVEAISGINVPRDAGTCTRCPMELRLAGSDDPWTCQVSIRWEYEATGGRRSHVSEEPFGAPIESKEDVELMLRRAQTAVLNLGVKLGLDYYLEKSGEDLKMLGEKAAHKFSRNVVCVDISGPGLPDLSFVDLPGIIQNDIEGNGEVQLIENLVRSYITPSNTLLLVILPMTDDIQNQKAAQLAREVDSAGSRTIGVLTKPDAIPAGSTGVKKNYADVLEGRAHQTKHGYYCTRQPDDAERASNSSPASARAAEDKFFAECKPWATSTHRHRLGTDALVAAIANLLTELIRADIPRIQEEVYKQRADCYKQIEELPVKSSDPVSDTMRLASEFSKLVGNIIQGSPEHTELVQANKVHYARFTTAILRSAPPFVARCSIGGVWPSVPSSQNRAGSNPIYLDEIKKRIQSSVTRELPNNVPYAVKQTFIQAFQHSWELLVDQCFEAVVHTLKTMLMKLAELHFGRFRNLHRVLRTVMLELVESRVETTERQLKFLLAYESNPAATQVTDVFVQLRKKYLNEYTEASKTPHQDPVAGNSTQPPASGSASTFSLGTTLPNSSSATSPFGVSPSIKRSAPGSFTTGGPAPPPPFSFGGPSKQESASSPALFSFASQSSTPNWVHTEAPKVTTPPPPEGYEQELELMAEIRAYFDVSYRRFVDYVPFAIDEHLLYALSRTLHDTLVEALGLAGGDAAARCARYLAEDPDVAAHREELLERKKRLDKVHKELYEFGL